MIGGRWMAGALAMVLSTNLLWADGTLVTVTTRRGSRLTGQSDWTAVRLQTPESELHIALDDIRVIRFADDLQHATVERTDGDSTTGIMPAATLQLRTEWGETTVGVVHLQELVPGGAPLLNARLRPHLPHWQGIRWHVELEDGSQVWGRPLSPGVTVHTTFGAVKVVASRLHRICFGEDRREARLELWNGDCLLGVPELAAVSMTTEFGELPIPAAKTRLVNATLGGVQLGPMNHLQAQGNAHFMSAVRDARPARFRGVTYAADQFISAHASGEVEYEFEEPVTEFHAIATLRDDYGGTKGNVVFKVVTDGTVVYTSKPVRNFGREDVYVRFSPARRIKLVTDANGPTWEDWSAWLHPEAR